jgi:2-oxoglutarate ferredoxin oxidoreductase subunit alpha
VESSTVVAGLEAHRQALVSAVVRFAGDSGDGMQLTGSQFALATAAAGNDLATFPDFPAEIRAPTGTTYGVSAFQINFGARTIKTSGDNVDVLVAMNPAALKVNISDVTPGGIVIADTGAFSKRNLRKAGYDADPLTDGTMTGYRALTMDISRCTLEAVKSHDLSKAEALRCKNFWSLGLVYWMFGRDRAPTVDWLREKFADRPDLAGANIAALDAGHAFGETAELPAEIGAFVVPRAALDPGLYRAVTGSEAMAWGLLAGARRSGLKLAFCSYPITPASALLHLLADLKEFDVVTFQAEDEIAAACAAIGASFAGSIGITSTSGPGMALKTEALGLAIATELPLVVIDSQRAGPSTGLPTKSEQSDLYQAVFGRAGDSPLAVIATRSPSDCFEVAVEAIRIATTFMTPVVILSDLYIANAAEPWIIPDVDRLTPEPVAFHTDPNGFHPFRRDDATLARPWAIPGTAGLEHRIGGLEKDYDTGEVSYDADNHRRMTEARAAKIDGIADHIPPQGVERGDDHGRVAVVGWGSTYGPISRAVGNLCDAGHDVSHIHIRHLWPLPRNLGDLLRGFEHVLVPETNTGQLLTLLRSRYLVPAVGLNKVTGRPFKIREIEDAIRARLEN